MRALIESVEAMVQAEAFGDTMPRGFAAALKQFGVTDADEQRRVLDAAIKGFYADDLENYVSAVRDFPPKFYTIVKALLSKASHQATMAGTERAKANRATMPW